MDRAASFDCLFDEHRRAVHAYLLGRTANQERAVDLLQETFLRVWRNLDAALSIPVYERKYYLLAIARGVAVDAYRRLPDKEIPLSEGSDVAATDDVFEAYSKLEELAEIDRAIMSLPEDLRIVLTMHVLGDMTSAEVGQALGRPAGTIRYQLSEARKRIARTLEARSPTLSNLGAPE